MKIKVILTWDDSRNIVYTKVGYHRSFIGNPKDYATRLNDCDKINPVKNCYPFRDENRYDFTIAFDKIICKCTLMDNDQRIGVHNGIHFVNNCICCIIEELKEYIKKQYNQCISGELNPGEAAKFEYEIDCDNCTVTPAKTIKFCPVDRLNLIKRKKEC